MPRLARYRARLAMPWMAPYDLRAAAFPVLDESHLSALARCVAPSLTRYEKGRALIEVGEQGFRFFIVKNGEIEIQAPADDGARTLVVLGPGEFTGDLAHLTGGPSVVRAVARTDSDVYAIDPGALREILVSAPAVSDLLLRAFIARWEILRRAASFAGVRVIGSQYSSDTHRVREFLARNHVPYVWVDVESEPKVHELVARFGIREDDTPVVVWHELFLRNPSNRQLADALGIRRPLEAIVYDLVIVGAGPAGLAGAVYGASEGLRALVLERTAPGGQASASMSIENYLGFPTGITGAELAERAVIQAQKFGADLSVASGVTQLRFDGPYAVVDVDGERVTAKCALIATGADYRRLPVEGRERFEGRGLYYAATFTEAQLCRGTDVVVVGGGNSAGQAAVYLAQVTRRVYLVVRDGRLCDDMSSYLAHRIERTPNVEVLLHTEVARLCGRDRLEAVEVVDRRTGERRGIEVRAAFSFIGAAPRTEWLPSSIERDSAGFVRTGPDLVRGDSSWSEPREPLLLETSRPGVFAAGDVRAGSTKRIASAVGEGAMAIRLVHEYLKSM